MRGIVKITAFLLIGLVVVGALWSLFKPQHPEFQAVQGPKTASADAPPAMSVPADVPGQAGRGASAGTEAFELTIKGGRLISGPALMQVHEGEQVTLTIKSDGSDEVHLHGYDLHASISAQQIARLRFTADRTGRFGLELHKAHTELGAIEVYPR
jgi:hypothetical protein